MSDQTTSESPEASSSFDIKTHFPAARIKKLMQSDEDIGKVAQATPVVVGRALEFFLANLVQASAEQAKISGTKRVTAQHVKSAIQSDDKFDFLVDTICSTEAKEE
ncbi:BUR6 [Cyberlindnera jadinii]|uniref:BUR6 protein n=1 Tax=Cyberlindnera jadinii (strain ATCC 18201 / CBS 1600 / BCRC 20928 / JCM 3617 / NBRC 0987 / NRRL Y-1542) TaxID=983966 RepID=A0A0H5CF11_CYBJN|nr:histone-fold-containing protein [Cyberlindnera jadinii NRRL Y-1542]ODV74336.1 histone-fold-containing protein [Cyberlindnera jadinii NRRL Y-1542]CEP23164.1 BUR6 [Cyberlindnera jadinii]